MNPGQDPLRQQNSRSLTQAMILFAALALGLSAILIAFILTSRLADRQFDLARLAEQQAAAVTRLATLAEGRAPRESMRAGLAELTRLIQAEERMTAASGTGSARIQDELAGVAQLDALMLGAPQPEALREMIRAIQAREAREVEKARSTLIALHHRAVALATLLAALVLACAAAGGWLLARRNQVLQAEVMARREQLEAIDASRRLFFAKTSHELRTPVQAIRSQAEITLAAKGEAFARPYEALEHIAAGTVSLGHRIDEMLALAHADNGQLQLSHMPADLAPVVEAAIGETAVIARSLDSAVQIVAEPGPYPVRGDARWLRQALIAVIGNALKFSPMGQPVTVALSRDTDMARIVVSDEGPGVVETDLPRIFDAFYQAQAGRDRGGNGLGLALARWVVEQHQGTIAAANLPAGGCAITLRLPLAHRVEGAA